MYMTFIDKSKNNIQENLSFIFKFLLVGVSVAFYAAMYIAIKGIYMFFTR